MRMIAALVLVFTVGCQPASQTMTLEGQTMGTTYRVVIVSTHDADDQESLRASVDDVLVEFNARFSNWDANSEVSRFNADESGRPVSVSADLLDVVRTADAVYQRSEGTFDITLAPLIELWGFGAPGPRADVPSDRAIEQALKLVGQDDQISRDDAAGTIAKTSPGASIYLAAIAKGEGIDRVAQHLSDLGFDNFMVEIGGDLFARGEGPTGLGWRVGIEEPTSGERKVERVVAIDGWGMATSGDYRNYFEQDGVRYSHIIDPETGRPVLHSTASVTVLAENAALADAWATALLVLGSERGLKIAEQEGLAAFFIDRREPRSLVGFLGAESSTFAVLSQHPKDE
ncbi:MAG: FAD:protein FMN transferase [Pseudomonadota bacterium]